MGYRNRRIEADRRLLSNAAAAQRRSAMTIDEIEKIMCITIASAIAARGVVAKSDFLLAGIPEDKIGPSFKRCMAKVRDNRVAAHGDTQ
jgi:hypothetical protein